MLQLKNITKTYVTGQLTQTALKGVSLAFRDSEFVSILGQSGSGKTTLLNIIGGLDQYDSGDLIINGVSTKKYKDKDWDSYRNNDIGFVFQSYNLISHQTILANVELALTLSGVDKKTRTEMATKALERVGLKDHIHKKPNQLSGGQMQRVAIARALVNNPSIILADEPTGALDSQTSVQIMELLKEISKDKLVIMVTHNPELAYKYSSRIINLADGEITNDNNPYEVVNYEVVEDKKKKKYTSMSFLTALSLSLNNLLTKKLRTFMTSFAGSIGIMGIALILSVSTGFQQYIDYIEESTLTSYPLTVYQETADATNAIISLMSEQSKESETDGTVVEKEYVNKLFSAVGKNDLKSFKYFLEENQEKVDEYCTSVVYTYSVSPLIYGIDATDKIVKLNPSGMSSNSSNSMMSMMGSSMGIYNEINVDNSIIEENYDILAGRLPEKYNEMLIVLAQRDSISDLLAYNLGLKDTSELKKVIMMVSTNQEVEHENVQYSYDQLMNLKFKLINPSDLYRYNEEYGVYQDITNDAAALKEVYDNSTDLSICGIVSLKEDAETSYLSVGVNYPSELTKVVMREAATSELVLKQLADETVDVFSNKPFVSETKSEVNFDNMISVDTNMLNSAFSINSDFGNIDMDKLQLLIEKYSKQLVDGVDTDISKARGELNQLICDLALMEYNDYCYSLVDENNQVTMTTTNAQQFADGFVSSDKYLDKLNELASKYNASSENISNNFSEILKTYLLTTVETLNLNENTDLSVALSYGESSVNLFVSTYFDDEKNAEFDLLASYLTATKAGVSIEENYQSIASNFTKDVTALFGKNMISVDANKIANAFKFNMSQEDLSSLMEAMMSSNDTSSAESNLLSLGYQDENEPTSISFYFKGFDSKEKLKDMITEYNDSQTDETKVISYADATGILMGSVETIINAVTYVLVAFVSISLVVSTIMIGVITLISVMERTKEIGILRAIGASKKDVGNVFNAETFIVGLLSGLIGIVGSELLLIPINKVLYHLTGIANLKAVLPLDSSGILILISVILTLVSGLIPARSASKKNPVEALRSE